ncbi:alcohol dehydrogenase [Cladophialophora psammophila CBS 110553]|uniref:Alcohol dehydrogenase n=1 Tax=Cladophialophora psammophila CBS 110553 TaxID=1182543 RepID=W9XAX1_9EURO|nr:alcohol dehydrogenase [Cladophialophora psammophila CBS 110553]EXJ74470.1 alcohol dehydrogenase [Cladophialophora psammophila CBS 110553]
MSLPKPLPTRPLGTGGPLIPAMGIGMMSLGHAYGSAGGDEERFAFLDAVHALGATHWDDADLYGDTETLLGKWFTANPDKRKDIFLTTKFGFAGQDASGAYVVRSDPEWVRAACKASLDKLKSDWIDLYYCHRVDGKTPIEETVKAMVELKNEGKIRYLGLSEVSATTLRRAHAVHPISALQIEYSPWALEIETNGVLQACKDLGVALVAYSPLGRGFLTGTIKSPADVQGDWRAMMPRFQPENFDKNIALVRQIEDLARHKGLSTSQLVLAWLRRQWDGVHLLPGTRSAERVKENLAALLVELTDEEDRAIRRACEECTVVGLRYPEAMAYMQLGETPEPDK